MHTLLEMHPWAHASDALPGLGYRSGVGSQDARNLKVLSATYIQKTDAVGKPVVAAHSHSPLSFDVLVKCSKNRLQIQSSPQPYDPAAVQASRVCWYLDQWVRW